MAEAIEYYTQSKMHLRLNIGCLLGHEEPNNVGAWQAYGTQAWRILFSRAGDKGDLLLQRSVLDPNQTS